MGYSTTKNFNNYIYTRLLIENYNGLINSSKWTTGYATYPIPKNAQRFENKDDLKDFFKKNNKGILTLKDVNNKLNNEYSQSRKFVAFTGDKKDFDEILKTTFPLTDGNIKAYIYFLAKKEKSIELIIEFAKTFNIFNKIFENSDFIQYSRDEEIIIKNNNIIPNKDNHPKFIKEKLNLDFKTFELKRIKENKISKNLNKKIEKVFENGYFDIIEELFENDLELKSIINKQNKTITNRSLPKRIFEIKNSKNGIKILELCKKYNKDFLFTIDDNEYGFERYNTNKEIYDYYHKNIDDFLFKKTDDRIIKFIIQNMGNIDFNNKIINILEKYPNIFRKYPNIFKKEILKNIHIRNTQFHKFETYFDVNFTNNRLKSENKYIFDNTEKLKELCFKYGYDKYVFENKRWTGIENEITNEFGIDYLKIGNKYENIDDVKLKNIKVLKIKNNTKIINNIDFSLLPNLEILIIDDNYLIGNINLSSNKKLKLIDLNNNYLESITGLEKLKDLKLLNLYNNDIYIDGNKDLKNNNLLFELHYQKKSNKTFLEDKKIKIIQKELNKYNLIHYGKVSYCHKDYIHKNVIREDILFINFEYEHLTEQNLKDIKKIMKIFNFEKFNDPKIKHNQDDYFSIVSYNDLEFFKKIDKKLNNKINNNNDINLDI